VAQGAGEEGGEVVSETIHALGELDGFIQFCLVWVVGCTIAVIGKVISRLYRTVMVCVRGWPPSHLDADGDWKPEPKSGDDE